MHVHGVMAGMSALLTGCNIHSSRKAQGLWGRMWFTKHLRLMWVLFWILTVTVQGNICCSARVSKMGWCTCAPSSRAHSPSAWRHGHYALHPAALTHFLHQPQLCPTAFPNPQPTCSVPQQGALAPSLQLRKTCASRHPQGARPRPRAQKLCRQVAGFP